ncbi:MAG: hypothetical protein MJY62_01895 [Bacteroidales bacterium]|nr:hypothetical protein [Bacteroidales bacterium]
MFSNEDDFKVAMSVLAVCSRVHSRIRIYAFQLMSNHIHFVVGGEVGDIMEFFDYFVSRLRKALGGGMDLSGFTLKLFPVTDLSYMRNAIVYVNRNGFVVNRNVTPFSYPWGSSQCFFQPLAARYVLAAGEPIGNSRLRALMHSRSCDEFKDLEMIDGYVSPLEFCDVGTAERLFRDAAQYFNLISRNVEVYSEVAKSIGESVFFSDSDLFQVALKLAKQCYGASDLRTLNVSDKLDLARRLHFDYNAGNKQIHRLLKIEQNTLESLFRAKNS